jgi:hypothetical protein
VFSQTPQRVWRPNPNEEDIMTTTTNQPIARLYYINSNGKSARWTAIGAVWPHQDGKGQAIQLDVPLVLAPDDRLVIRAIETGDASGQMDA